MKGLVTSQLTLYSSRTIIMLVRLELVFFASNKGKESMFSESVFTDGDPRTSGAKITKRRFLSTLGTPKSFTEFTNPANSLILPPLLRILNLGDKFISSRFPPISYRYQNFSSISQRILFIPSYSKHPPHISLVRGYRAWKSLELLEIIYMLAKYNLLKIHGQRIPE